MEISPGMEMVNKALWLKKEGIIIVNDLHLGYEENLQKRGVLVPHFQLNETLRELEEIIKHTKPKAIILNGDLKHEFGNVSKQEGDDVLQLLDFLLKKKLEMIIIQGNHDSIIKPVAEKRNIKIKNSYQAGDLIIVHGDKLIKTKAKRIIIGHEHPAISLREGSKWEKYKCFLKGTWKRKELIVIPSFNPLLEGSDIVKEELLSPYLNNLTNFEIFALQDEEVFNFGKLKDLVKKMR